MFGSPLTEQEVLPSKVEQKQPYGFDQALGDVMDFLGMGGAEQTHNQPFDESLGPSQEYQPTESNNLQDRQREEPDPLSESYKRYGGNPKEAAARISLMPHGVAPFLSAAYDVYTGQNNPRGLTLSELYRKRNIEASQLEQDQAPATRMVRENLPLIAGIATGALPSRAAGLNGVISGMGRGMGAGGILGGVAGYFDPSLDGQDLDSPKRIQGGIQEGAMGMFQGGLGGVAGHTGMKLGERVVGGIMGRPPGAPPPINSELAKPRVRAPIDVDMGASGIARRLYMTPEELEMRIKATKLQNDQIGDIISRPAPERPSPPKKAPAPISEPVSPKPSAGLNEAAVRTKAEPAKPNETTSSRTEPVETERKPVPPVESRAGLNEAISQPKAKPEKPQAASNGEPAFKPTKPPFTQLQFKKWNNTTKGKAAWSEVQADTRRAKLDAEARTQIETYNPKSMNEVLAQSGKTPITVIPDKNPKPITINPGEEKGGYIPTQRRGTMQIAEDIINSSGRTPSKWNADDKEQFIRAAARHSEMRPSQIKNLLTSYGEGTTRATRGLSNKRIGEIINEERIAQRLKPQKKE